MARPREGLRGADRRGQTPGQPDLQGLGEDAGDRQARLVLTRTGLLIIIIIIIIIIFLLLLLLLSFKVDTYTIF